MTPASLVEAADGAMVKGMTPVAWRGAAMGLGPAMLNGITVLRRGADIASGPTHEEQQRFASNTRQCISNWTKGLRKTRFDSRRRGGVTCRAQWLRGPGEEEDGCRRRR